MSEELKPSAPATQPEDARPVSAIQAKLDEQRRAFGSAKYNQLEGQLNELKLHIARFDEAMEKVVNGMNGQALKLMQQIMALEQTTLSLSKIVTALSQALIKKAVLADSDIMAELRTMEDGLEEERIKALESAGVIKLGKLATADSILIVKQELLSQDGSKKAVSSYRTVELSNMKEDDPLRAELLNKGAGDTVSALKDGETFLFTVLSVYEIVEQNNVQPEA